jgi:hypothetical protein
MAGVARMHQGGRERWPGAHRTAKLLTNQSMAGKPARPLAGTATCRYAADTSRRKELIS